MRLIVNGDELDVTGNQTVAQIVARVAPARRRRGTAVALNGEVIPRGLWVSTELSENDRVEVLDAIGGG